VAYKREEIVSSDKNSGSALLEHLLSDFRQNTSND
jgi:hypothetical protein